MKLRERRRLINTRVELVHEDHSAPREETVVLGVDVGEGRVVFERPLALRVQMSTSMPALPDNPSLFDEPGPSRLWVPKSQLDDESELQHEGDEGVLIVAPWFARKLGFWTRKVA